MKLKVICVILLLFFVGVDFTSKYYAFLLLYNASFPIITNFLGITISFSNVANYGAAFGILGSYPSLLATFRLAVSFCVIVFVLMHDMKTLQAVGLTLIAAGAFGNSIDYFLYGHVVDMIALQFKTWSFPVFNVADCAICFGSFLVLLFSQDKKKGKKN